MLLKKPKSKHIITIDLSGCKNMTECNRIMDAITSGRVKINVKKLKNKKHGTVL